MALGMPHTDLLVEQAECLLQLLSQRVLVHSVGHRVNQGAELVEFDFAGAIGVKFANQSESLGMGIRGFC